MSDTTEITCGYYKGLMRAYNIAVKDKKETFAFRGDELLIGYAKQVIEYLKPKFEKTC